MPKSTNDHLHIAQIDRSAAVHVGILTIRARASARAVNRGDDIENVGVSHAVDVLITRAAVDVRRARPGLERLAFGILALASLPFVEPAGIDAKVFTRTNTTTTGAAGPALRRRAAARVRNLASVGEAAENCRIAQIHDPVAIDVCSRTVGNRSGPFALSYRREVRGVEHAVAGHVSATFTRRGCLGGDIERVIRSNVDRRVGRDIQRDVRDITGWPIERRVERRTVARAPGAVGPTLADPLLAIATTSRNTTRRCADERPVGLLAAEHARSRDRDSHPPKTHPKAPLWSVAQDRIMRTSALRASTGRRSLSL
jgi:hypothetical protein